MHTFNSTLSSETFRELERVFEKILQILTNFPTTHPHHLLLIEFILRFSFDSSRKLNTGPIGRIYLYIFTRRSMQNTQWQNWFKIVASGAAIRKKKLIRHDCISARNKFQSNWRNALNLKKMKSSILSRSRIGFRGPRVIIIRALTRDICIDFKRKSMMF